MLRLVLLCNFLNSIVYQQDSRIVLTNNAFFILFAITILVVSIDQIEAYDGKVVLDANIMNLVEGDIIKVDVFLVDVEPYLESLLEVKIIEKGTGLSAEQITTIPSWTFDDRNALGDKVWKASFEFDTVSTNLTPETIYYLRGDFEDKNGITSIFAFTQTVTEKMIEQEESIKESILPAREIPSWIRDVFVFYAEWQIDDETLLNAIEFLVSEQIIKIR